MSLNTYLDLAAKNCSPSGKPISDRQLAMRLEVSAQQICRYRQGKDFPELEEFPLRLANLAQVDPQIVLVDLSLERTKCPAAKRVWRRVAKQMGRAAAVVVVVSAANLQPAATSVADAGQFVLPHSVYYVKSWLVRLAEIVSQLVRFLPLPIPGARRGPLSGASA